MGVLARDWRQAQIVFPYWKDKGILLSSDDEVAMTTVKRLARVISTLPVTAVATIDTLILAMDEAVRRDVTKMSGQ